MLLEGIGIAQVRALLVYPSLASQRRQAFGQGFPQIDQVSDIGLGIMKLVRMQGAPGPIGKSLPFVNLSTQELIDQPPVTTLGSEPQQRRDDLFIEYRTWQPSGFLKDELHVLTAGVDHLLRVLVTQKLPQRFKVLDNLAVDDRDLPIRPN